MATIVWLLLILMNNQSTNAAIRFLVPGNDKPVYFASQGGAEAQLSINAKFEDVEVPICDARILDVPTTLDREGFELHEHHTAIGNFYDIENQQTAYAEELKKLVLPIVGAKALHVFDHTLRSDSADIREAHKTREAAAIVHNDYTIASARKRVRDLLGDDKAEKIFESRFAIVNVWRSIAGPVFQSPLTCCDAQSVNEENIFASERRAQDRIGELELVSHNPAQKWFYFPEMENSEVLLIKTFDSTSDGRATRSIHTAFKNPLAPKDAPPRESMESRMLVFFFLDNHSRK
jgi:hypothetical protein